LGHIRRSPVLCSEMAPYVFTGMLTRPKLIAPFHIGLGGNLSSSKGSREKMAFLVYSDKSIARRVA